MGMFDHVNFECECPQCGGLVKDFQSKDGPCFMKTLEVEEVVDFYSCCDNCGLWLEFSRTTGMDKEITIKDFYLKTHKYHDNLKLAKGWYSNPKKAYMAEQGGES